MSTELNDRDLEFVKACCLGDGHLKVAKGCTSLSMTHAAKQSEYLRFKAYELNRILGRSANVAEFDNSGYPGVRYSVSRTDVLTPIRNDLYVDGKKRVTERFLSGLGDLALAIWWMDDGSLTVRKRTTKSGTITNGARIGWLSTYTDTESESQLIADWVGSLTGFAPRVYGSKGKFRVGFNSHSLRALCPTISSYVIPSMQYKVDFRAKNKKRLETSPSMFMRKPMNDEGDKLARAHRL